MVRHLFPWRCELVSQEVAERFRDALWRLEEDRDVEPLVEVHAEDYSMRNVAAPRTFSGHDGLRSSGRATARLSMR